MVFKAQACPLVEPLPVDDSEWQARWLMQADNNNNNGILDASVHPIRAAGTSLCLAHADGRRADCRRLQAGLHGDAQHVDADMPARRPQVQRGPIARL